MMLRILCLALLFSTLLATAPPAGLAAECTSCHQPAKFAGKVVHPPVRQNQCASCHSPHVSRHKGLLLQAEVDLCFSCHGEVQKNIERSASQHQPVREGRCSECHAPHASEFRGLLKTSGGALCFGCHESTKQSYKVAHKPYQQGECSACHTPHASDDYRLLKKSGSALCFDCHQSTAALQASHLGRDLAKVDCLSCHNPHGGDSRALLRAVRHHPFAQNNCKACHGRSTDTSLCIGCHKGVLESFNAVHSHLGAGAGAGNNSCTSCHDPHVGDRKGLLPNNLGSVCRSCHQDTFTRREQMLHKHQGWNACADCHFGHAGNNPAMLKNGQQVCAICHEKHEEFSHPMGDAVLDPRNGKPMDCLTCHNANEGTMYRHFLHGSGERGLCVQCHQSY